MGRELGWSQRSRRRSLWLGLFVTSMVVPPLLMSGAWIWPGALQVWQTGICPPAPPDIPAYPCSIGAYLSRMTFGLWALTGHLAIWLSWFVAGFILWGLGLVSVAVYRSWRSE